MFVVFSRGERVYFGDSLNLAVTAFLTNKDAQMLNLGSPVYRKEKHSETEDTCCCKKMAEDEASGLSQAAQKLLDNLKKAGFTSENIERLARGFEEEGSKLTAEVKSLGIKGMRTVGDKFVALGELLRQTPDDEGEGEG